MAQGNYRGSKIVPVRIPDETLARIEVIVARSVLHSGKEPYTVSSWIKKCIAEELRHLEAGSSAAKKARKARKLAAETAAQGGHRA
jgi:hypothetical protein